MSNRTKISLALLLIVTCAALYRSFLWTDSPKTVRSTLSAAEALQGDTTGYARASPGYTIRFPEDHGPHNDYKTEWWYFTGNLVCEDAKPVGYQFTVFRTALTPAVPDSSSAEQGWRTNQLYTAHFAVSDSRGSLFRFDQKIARGAAGLAGATGEPFRAWVEDWEVIQTGDSMQLQLRAAADNKDFAVDLRLQPTRPPVLHGDRGLSPKSHEPGNASFYYSFTRVRTEGRMRVGDRECIASGNTWMDHEWSTSALGPTQIGWDWFALRLSNGHDLMYFQVREREDRHPPFVEGTLIGSDGRTYRLDSSAVRLTAVDTWTSPHSGASYPSEWQLEIPDEALLLRIRPILADQELRLAVRYWEGAVTIEGTDRGAPVSGSGYVELTGYGDAAFGDISGKEAG